MFLVCVISVHSQLHGDHYFSFCILTLDKSDFPVKGFQFCVFDIIIFYGQFVLSYTQNR